MNQGQKKYAAKRIESIRDQKKKPIPENEYRWESCFETAEIKKGNFTVNSKKDIIANYKKHDSSSFITLKNSFEDYEAKHQEEKDKIYAYNKALDKEAEEVIDAIWLGDADQALEAMNAFSRFEPWIVENPFE